MGCSEAGASCVRRGDVRLAGRRLAGSACGLARHRPLHPLSVNALRHCHLSQRERQERSNAGAGYALAPPLGELSPQVTERAEQRHRPCANHREDECRGRPPDVPRHKRRCYQLGEVTKGAPCGAPFIQPDSLFVLQMLLQLALDALQGIVHGLCAPAERGCDLLVGVAVHEQVEHLLFKRRQQLLDAAEDVLRALL